MALFLRFCLALLLSGCNNFSSLKPSGQASTFETLFGKDVPGQVILFKGVVTPESVSRTIEQLKTANNKNYKDIYLIINSPGGNVHAGFELSVAIENSKTPVTCVVDGMAASMGYYILQSCKTRIMTKRSVLMIHQASTEIRGDLADIVNTLARLKSLNEALLFHYAHRMKVSEEEVGRRIFQKEWWINWKEGLEVGSIDQAIPTLTEFLQQKNCFYPM